MPRLRTYKELIRFDRIEDRYEYLKLACRISDPGVDPIFRQWFYHENGKWKTTRNDIILRDKGCDLAVQGFEIHDRVIVHHINPLSNYDIEHETDACYDPENLVVVSHRTHNAVHYGDASQLPHLPISRYPGDTKLW